MLGTTRPRLDGVFGRRLHLIQLDVGHRAGAVDQRLPVLFSADFDAISSTGESIKTVPIIEKIQLMFQLPEKWSDNSDKAPSEHK